MPHHDIHKPVIDGSSVYERIVIWVKMNLWKNSTARTVTSPPVFRKVLTAALTSIRVRSSLQSEIQTIIANLEDSLRSTEFGCELLSDTYFYNS